MSYLPRRALRNISLLRSLAAAWITLFAIAANAESTISPQVLPGFESYEDQVQQMYVAYYGRPGDPGGIDFWAGRLDGSGGDLTAIVDAFGNSEEFNERYGGLGNVELVNSIYQQMFGRDADPEGLDFYGGWLDTNVATLATIALNIADGVQPGNSDFDIFSNKMNAANAFTDAVIDLCLLYDATVISEAKALLDAITADPDSVQTALEVIDSWPQDECSDNWERVADNPTPRLGLATVEANGKVYAIGGYPRAGGAALSAFEAYNPDSDTWTVLPDMPTARRRPAAATVEDRIYVLGGDSGQQLNTTYATVDIYDSTTNEWTTGTPMSTARFAHSAVVLDGLLYVIGGFNSDGVLASVEAYNPVSDTWTTKSAMPMARGLAAVEVVEGKLYVIGGSTTDPANGHSEVQIYNAASDSWTNGTSMPTARASICSSVVDGKIYVIGGADGGRYTGPIYATVEAFDPNTDAWSQRADMPTARWNPGCSPVNRRIYVVGGGGDWDQHPGLPQVEAFTPGNP